MVLAGLWIIGAIGGYMYALQQHIPVATALKVLPAFLMEVTFFYVLGSERLRSRVEKWPPVVIALALTLAAVLPYSEATLALGSFGINAFLIIAGLAAVVSFWYVILPQRPGTDVLLLALIGFVWLSRILPQQYPTTFPKLQLPALAQLMWFRTGIFAMVSLRRSYDVGFGLWPEKRHWRIGVMYYLIFLPIAAVLAWWVGFAKPRVPPNGWEKTSLLAIATFFGVLWVLALGEEFFFRGLLQQWMTTWLGNDWAGLIAAAVIFGAAHLWFRAFPNWRIVPIAVLLGICCGLAFRQTRSIRAPMVTHALVVTTWRIFFA
jgi:membrane protease YdiL (CAAX protease family)